MAIKLATNELSAVNDEPFRKTLISNFEILQQYINGFDELTGKVNSDEGSQNTGLYPPGINLISDSQLNDQTKTIEDAYNLALYPKDSRVFKLQAGKFYTYRDYIWKAPRDGSVMVSTFDKNGKLLDQFMGNNYRDNSNGYSVITFIINSDVDHVQLFPYATTERVSGAVQWSQEMLEAGSKAHSYEAGIGSMDASTAISTLLEKLSEQLQIDDSQVGPVNLLIGTTKEKKTVVNSKLSWDVNPQAYNGSKCPVTPNTTYTYHAKIIDTPIKDTFVKASVYDKNGIKLKMVVGNWYRANADGISSVTFNTGDGASYVSVTPLAFQTQQAGTFSFAEEMLEVGTEVHAHSLAIEEMSSQDLSRNIITNLENKINDGNRGQSLPKINITGNYLDMLNDNKKSVLPFEFKQGDRDIKAYAEMEWQGDSSKNLPKKGFKFKCYQDELATTKFKWQPEPSMYKSHIFQLKAYYTDKFHLRDLAAAEILSWFIANNETAPDRILQANHFGAITGVPCLVYFGDNFYGLGTIKTKSSANLYNCDSDDPNQIAVEGNSTGAANFMTAKPTVGDNGDFTLESDNDEKAQIALQELADFIVNSSDADFVANFDQHIDTNSICDYILFNYLINNTDAWSYGNNVFITYDAKKWFAMPYDFDSSMNSNWQPGVVTPVDKDYFEKDISNHLLQKVVRLMPDKLLARYNELASLGVLDLTKINAVINKHAKEIGQGAYDLEWKQWPDNKAYQLDTTIDDIKHMFVVRKRLLKDKLQEMQK